MLDHFKQAILGLLFWIAFTPGVVLILILQFLGIFGYTITGNPGLRDWVFRTGEGTDGLNNAAWFDGSPKETISSHTGRWFESGRTDIPWKFRFIKWLTDKFQPNHVLESVEEPFKNEPL